MNTDSPIDKDSFEQTMEIVKQEVDADIPEDRIQSEILSHNREFYEDASEEEITLNLLMDLMSAQKIADFTGHHDTEEKLEDIIEDLREDIERTEP